MTAGRGNGRQPTMSANDDFVIEPQDVRFRRRPTGHVVMVRGGTEHVVGAVLSAFPLTRAGHMVAVRDEAGEELGMIESLPALDAESRRVLAEVLERSYFMPLVTDIHDIREELNVVTWEVETDRGARTFEVRHVLHNIRRMGRRRIVIKDVDGNRYEVRDWLRLPPLAQRLIHNYL